MSKIVNIDLLLKLHKKFFSKCKNLYLENHLFCSLQPCPLLSAPARKSRGQSLRSWLRKESPHVSVKTWDSGWAAVGQCAGQQDTNAVALSSVGQKIQHGHHLSDPGARRAAQHHVEHRRGDFQLWECAGKEPEEPHSQDWRLQWGWDRVFYAAASEPVEEAKWRLCSKLSLLIIWRETRVTRCSRLSSGG